LHNKKNIYNNSTNHHSLDSAVMKSKKKKTEAKLCSYRMDKHKNEHVISN